ncbi:hypothetical protein Hanom_Chr14g01296631 [Helianthus anomalus]
MKSISRVVVHDSLTNLPGVVVAWSPVTKCESQLEAGWTALKAWKSDYKRYLNKEDVLFQ